MPIYRAKADTLRHHFEALKALCETVTIRPVLDAARQVDGSAIRLLQGFEHRPVVLPEQSLGDVQPVRVNANQMRIECGMVDFRQRDTIGHHRLAELLVFVGDDVGRIQEKWLGQARQRTSATIGGDDGFAERCLMQALLNRAQGVTPFQRRVLAHEGVFYGVVALEDLAMNVTLVVVPNLAARLGKDGLDRQQISHLLRLEDAPLWIDKRYALAIENKAGLQLARRQMIVNLAQPSHMLECGYAQEHVTIRLRHARRLS